MQFFSQLCRNFGHFAFHIILMGSLAFMGACGKEAKDEKAPQRFQEESRTGEMEVQLSRPSVDCDNGISCPDGIAKISIVDRGRLKTCTGFLVNSVTVATASSCLTERLRLSASDSLCKSEVHVFFGRADFRAAKRVGCERFLLVSPLEGSDPVLWRNDLTYIMLDEPIYRRAMRISRDGIQDGQTLTMWKVDQENDQVGIIRKTQCKGILNSYVNPMSASPFDPSYTLSGCVNKTGNKGAPVLDENGRWVGVYSGPLSSAMMTEMNSPAFRAYFTEGLKSIGHVSNTVCLPALRDDNPVTRRQCFRDLDSTSLIQQRARLLGGVETHEAARLQIAAEVSRMKPYLEWDVELVQDGDRQGSFKVKLKPKCFKPINDWIRLFRSSTTVEPYYMIVRDWRLTIGLDSATHVVSRIDRDNTKRVDVKFSVSRIRSSRTSYVEVKANGLTINYENINECQ